MFTKLKVKIKSLAAEAIIIRHEERKALRAARWIQLKTNTPVSDTRPGTLHNELRNHRTGIVRSEARSAQLAYAFLRGRPYSTVEKPISSTPCWSTVSRLVTKHIPSDAPRGRLLDWAGEHPATATLHTSIIKELEKV